MRKSIFPVLMGFLVSLQAQEQTTMFSDSAVLRRMKTDIFVLASDTLEGREAGTIGDSLAADFIISRFREIGLEPKGNDSGSYFQPVTFKYDYFPEAENFLYTDIRNYQHRTDFGVTSFSANARVTGELLDVGHGICDTLLATDEYTGKEDPSGRVLLMEFPLPGKKAADSSFRARQSARERISEAFRRGALAVLLWNSSSPDYTELFDFGNPSVLQGPVLFVAQDVARQLKKQEGRSVYLMATRNISQMDYTNLIGYLNNNADKTVIVGAHYDHVGINRKNIAKCGADDNASGVALILEMALYLKHQERSRYNYLFIAFGAEEQGLIGSEYFCKHPVIPLETVSFMCNFDMVGRLGAEGNRITALGTGTSPQWDRIYREMPEFPFRVKKYKGPSSYSDQECFYKREVPVFYLTTGLHSDYHTYRDRPERINFTGMVSITKFAEEFISRTEEVDKIEFQEVSGNVTFFADLNYYFRQIAHFFDVPLADWP